MNRPKIIPFRVNEHEENTLKQLAELHQVSPSELIRNLLKEAARQAGLLPELTIEKPVDELALAA